MKEKASVPEGGDDTADTSWYKMETGDKRQSCGRAISPQPTLRSIIYLFIIL
jgi:hypothetical protein